MTAVQATRRPDLDRAPLRPLLKWAGGKRQLLPVLRRYYPSAFNRYIEPFFGSGAVFFDLVTTGRLDDRAVLLADDNADLVSCYAAVRDTPEEVILELERLADEYRLAGSQCYYEVRDQRFNPARAAGTARPAALAAMLIFLNRTGFNGLFRLNQRGQFNVPAGRHQNPRICDSANIRAVARALRAPGVRFVQRSFEETLAEARRGDFVYCDPPYAPLTPTARFAHYTAGGFGTDAQHRLQQAVVGAVARGAHVVLSNSSAEEIEQLYGGVAARHAGLTMSRVPARRAINSRASARGVVQEVLVSNVPPQPVLEAIRPTMAKATLAGRRARPARTA